jgi:hypothetical protein
MTETPPRDRFTVIAMGSVSFDCVNGRNVHLPAAAVTRRLDRVNVWFPFDWSRSSIHPFFGVMRRRGILSLFGPDGSVLSEDIVQVRSVQPILPGENSHRYYTRASCYRYHPRPRIP